MEKEENECLIWFVYKIPHLSERSLRYFVEYGMNPYLPMIETEIPSLHHPAALNYLFVKGTVTQVETLTQQRGIRPIYHRLSSRLENGLYLTVPERQMELFQQVVELTRSNVTICELSDYDLEQGDKVEIVGGMFDGFKGILLTEQGKKDGKVSLRLSENGNIAFLPPPIKPDHIKVISFAPNTTHFYKKIALLEQKIDRALEIIKNGEELPLSLTTQFRLFLWRYDRLQEPHVINQVKLLVSFYSIQLVLGMKKEAAMSLQSIEVIRSNSRIPKSALGYIISRQKKLYTVF